MPCEDLSETSPSRCDYDVSEDYIINIELGWLNPILVNGHMWSIVNHLGI